MKIRRLLPTLLAALALGPATSAVADSPTPMSGAYVGAGNPTALSSFELWRGASAPIVVDYLGRQTWTDITDPSWLLSRWRPLTTSGDTLVLAVPLLPQSGGTLAQGATGQFNGYFKTLAQRLVAGGDGKAILRLGWEANGTWFPWSLHANSTTASPASFVGYWRQVVSTMRSVAGARFKFDWTVNNGWSAVPAAQAYPGDAYVDYIGLDAYDQGWAANGGPIADPTARWQQIASSSNGLSFWAAFARQHTKLISVPEWGLVTNTPNGGGDDPYYIDMMFAWLRQNHAAYDSYFNAAGSVINGGAAPHAAAEYARLWSAPAAPARSGTPGAGSFLQTGAVSSGRATIHATPRFRIRRGPWTVRPSRSHKGAVHRGPKQRLFTPRLGAISQRLLDETLRAGTK